MKIAKKLASYLEIAELIIHFAQGITHIMKVEEVTMAARARAHM